MEVVQYLMNHDGYLSGKHYRRPTIEQIFQSYKKASSQLMISDELRLRLQLEKNKDEESSRGKRIELLESKLRNVEILLLEFKSRKGFFP